MHVERRLLPVMSVVLGGSLLVSACTPAPQANESLVGALTAAHADSQALQDSAPEIAHVRTRHAEELTTEVDRLCGFTKEGYIPDSCTVEIPDIAATPTDDINGTVTHSQAEILSILDSVPTESLPVLAQQYIELSLFDARTDLTELPTDLSLTAEADQHAAASLLDRENEAAWILGVALVFAERSLHESITETITAHQHRAEQLSKLLAPFGYSGAPAAGYMLTGYPEPVDSESAEALRSDIRTDATQAWLRTASLARNSQWRQFALEVAGDIARY